MNSGKKTSLSEFVVADADGDTMLDQFVQWVAQIGLELYPAQEEAVLEVMGERHVILNTPTGSGKSLVAAAMHFRAICEGKRSYYTAPIKALVSEKFFEMCEQLGADNVGMLTGDASINRDAPVICCTAEILANIALREGRYARVDYAVLDEFHYYADRDRGAAWQLPLLELCDVRFLLMSATLGDMGTIATHLKQSTGTEAVVVRSRDRPVPLDFYYRETSLHRTVRDLVEEKKAPVYVVNFTQREAAEQAQNLTSMNITTKEEKRAIADAIGTFRFDTPYGKDIRRLTSHGIGLHHAGLLPKYRLLVERLAQQGLLKVVSGTDTLGVGVNIPIRTVLFTKLFKFDGAATRILSVRDFQQISGRAGRKGFDDRGTVVCQAPEHVVENKELEEKEKQSGKKKKAPRKKPPRGYIHYDRNTFKKLIESDPEPLRSSFSVSHGLLANLLERTMTHGKRDGGYRRLVDIIARSHESDSKKSRHRKRAAQLFRALHGAGVVEVAVPSWSDRPHVALQEGLQPDFSLHQALSLFALEALLLLDHELETYPLDLLTVVESILEDPRVILLRQEDKLKGDKVAELKAQGMEYEDRMRELEQVTYPKPNADFIYQTFDAFRQSHPWVHHDNVHPKSIARDLFERYATFNEYLSLYGLQRSEGVLLRYLTGCFKAVVQTVPDEAKTESVYDLMAFLRAMLERVDSSLVREWESMLHPQDEATGDDAAPPARAFDITRDKKALFARIRAEMHRLVKALGAGDYEEAAVGLRVGDDGNSWEPEQLEALMAPFFAEYEQLITDHRARFPNWTHITPAGDRRWQVQQTLLDPQEDNLWAIVAEIDLTHPDAGEGPLLSLSRIGP